MKYDLIVIGAGPAGCVAASVAAGKGLNVLVLEKRRLGWEKPCAGAVTHRGIEEFKIPQEVFDRPFKGIFLCAPSLKALTVDLKDVPPGGLCMRAKLDTWLVEQAKEKGAVFKEKTNAISPIVRRGAVVGVRAKVGNGPTKQFDANLVIAADGTPSHFAGKMHLFNGTNLGTQAAGTQYQMSLPDEVIDDLIGDRIEIYFGSKWCPQGYTWIFPKTGVVTVGNGVWMDTVTKQKLKTRALLDGFIRNHSTASKKLAKAKILYFQSHMLGFWGIVSKHVGDGYIIIGDAGGFVSYPTGEGIYYSMKAGQFAAETSLEASEKGDFSEAALQGFNERVQKSVVGSDMVKGLALRKMFLEDDAKQEMSVGMMLKDPRFADTIGKLIAGYVPYKTFVPQDPINSQHDCEHRRGSTGDSVRTQKNKTQEKSIND